jgi:hypothetical protein
MSIIYEALKKTQDKLKFATTLNPREKLKLKLYIVFIFAALLGCSYALTTLFYSPAPLSSNQNKKQIAGSASEQKQPVQFSSSRPAKTSSERFILNGVVNMDNEKVALINDEMVRKGEFIDGAYVINILDNKVYLDLGGKPVVLKIK